MTGAVETVPATGVDQALNVGESCWVYAAASSRVPVVMGVTKAITMSKARAKALRMAPGNRHHV